MKNLCVFLILGISVLLFGCTYNSFNKKPDKKPQQTWTANSSIATLHAGQVTEDLIVHGVVTTSDSTENFYKEFYVTDLTSGATLVVHTATYKLYTLYRQGMVVAVRLQGLEVVDQDHVLNIFIPANLEDLNLRVNFQGQYAEIQPKKVMVSELSSIPMGSYVELDNVFLCNNTAVTFSGRHTFAQTPAPIGGESEFSLYTSPFATFASEMVPHQVVNMRGFVTWRDNRIQIKLLGLADIF
ncbi:MAG: DUF5689 domain-containing protein [Mucinivorans sp.]